MTDLVDQMFPPIHRRWEAEYTDAAYWRPPLDAFGFDLPPMLAPPSPALSARSDTSTLARLRSGFSLGHRRATSDVPAQPHTPEKPQRDGPLRQMSSFERLGSTLRITSQTPFAPAGGDDERGDWRATGGRGGARARSVDSMPGSLPGSEDETVWEEDEEDPEAGFAAGESGDENLDDVHDPAEHTFDEDLLAAGEMEDVPYL
jgi:phosphatidate phosphatase LPIN